MFEIRPGWLVQFTEQYSITTSLHCAVLHFKDLHSVMNSSFGDSHRCNFTLREDESEWRD